MAVKFLGQFLMERGVITPQQLLAAIEAQRASNPLLGDLVYGRRRAEKGLEGQCLHAKELRFLHPRTGEPVTVTSELPAYFQDVLKRLGEPV